MTLYYDSVVAAIGGTPLVRLDLGPDTEVFAKLELQNLFGMKDRVARQVLMAAEASGELAPGAPIVESSSGTMALGLALVGTALGHPVHIVTDPRIDPVTLAKLQALGCVVEIVQAMSGQGWQSARLERLQQLLESLPGAFWPRQYSNPQNPEAYRHLAAELASEVGDVDILVGATGSGGSLSGSARALRRLRPGLRVVAVDSVGSVLFGQPDRPGRLQSGLGNSLMPPNLDHAAVDEVHWLNDREAFAGTRALAAEQAIFGGNTSGSVYRVLKHLARREPPGTRIVGIMPDRGDRYFSTVYDDEYWKSHDLLDLADSAEPEPVSANTQVEAWSYRVLARSEAH
jgi:cysteine synthase A